jgi:hypothetical protein
MSAGYSNRGGTVKGFSICADKSRVCAARIFARGVGRAFHSAKIRKKSEVVPVNCGFLAVANLLRFAAMPLRHGER